MKLCCVVQVKKSLRDVVNGATLSALQQENKGYLNISPFRSVLTKEWEGIGLPDHAVFEAYVDEAHKTHGEGRYVLWVRRVGKDKNPKLFGFNFVGGRAVFDGEIISPNRGKRKKRRRKKLKDNQRRSLP